MTYIFEFDIVPGKTKEFWQFMKEEGTKFWLQFPEVKKYEIFSTVGGDASFEGHVELENYSVYDRIMNHPDARKVGMRTAEYTMNTKRRFIQSVKTFEQTDKGEA